MNSEIESIIEILEKNRAMSIANQVTALYSDRGKEIVDRNHRHEKRLLINIIIGLQNQISALMGLPMEDNPTIEYAEAYLGVLEAEEFGDQKLIAIRKQNLEEIRNRMFSR